MPRLSTGDNGYFRTPFTTVFGSPGAVRVLRALSRHGGVLAVPTIQQATGLTNAGAHRVLRSLVDAGVVRREGQRRVTAYRLDATHPLAPAIDELFAAEAARVDRVLNAVRAAATPHRPTAVWLYGSAARGDDTPASDLDIAVVLPDERTESTLAAIREALTPTEAAERVTLSVIGLSLADVARLSGDAGGAADPLWRAIDRDAVPLLGEPPALVQPRRTTGRPSRGASPT